MDDFKYYKRKGLSEMRQYVIGEDLTGISVSDNDKQLGKEFPNVFAQGYIARNPNNHAEQWYIAKKYFDDNLEPAEPTPLSDQGHVWREIKVSERLPEKETNPDFRDCISITVIGIQPNDLPVNCFYNFKKNKWFAIGIFDKVNIVSWLEKHPPLKTEDKE